ncbi:MAG: serine/threonine protein kinase, partial [Planctomycetaceae bacterium]|nr:serine/threonine protein kinase [Planctomycetaceae bacterium]
MTEPSSNPSAASDRSSADQSPMEAAGQSPGSLDAHASHAVDETRHDATDSPPDSSAPNSAGEADLSSMVISEFQLIRRLGSGGMADVYLAHQIPLDRAVAVKILKPDVGGNQDIILKRFEREARTAAGVSHPNIVQVITTGREGTLSYIVQEYIAGLNLSQWIRKHGCPDAATGIRWMIQVAEALGAAASAGIVHRDVKPEN